MKIISKKVGAWLGKLQLNITFSGPKNGKSRCDYTTVCKKCEDVYYTNKGNPHKCGQKWCYRCNCQRITPHNCLMPISKKNEKKLTRRRVYFDIEVCISPKLSSHPKNFRAEPTNQLDSNTPSCLWLSVVVQSAQLLFQMTLNKQETWCARNVHLMVD